MKLSKSLLVVLSIIGGSNLGFSAGKEIALSGLWLMSDADKICKFLSIQHDGKYYDYALSIAEDGVNVEIFFVNDPKPYLAKIVKVGTNEYKLVKEKKERTFVVNDDPKISGSAKRILYFTDAVPFPPKKNRFKLSGIHYYDAIRDDPNAEYSIKYLLEEQIRLSEIQSPDEP